MPTDSTATSEIPRPAEAAASALDAATEARRARWLGLVVIGLSAVYAASYLWIWQRDFRNDNDFFVFWSAAEWVRAFGFDPAIYQLEAFHEFQRTLLGFKQGYHPFPYPPTFLLLILPLELLAESMAYPLFAAATLIFMLAVLLWRRPVMAVSLVVSPASLMTAVIGQVSFLTTGLLGGGLRLVNDHPWWAGFLLGLLSVKPQLGILVPVVLIAVRAWRALAATALVTLLLPVPSLILGGWELWHGWLSLLPAFTEETAFNISSNARLMANPLAALVTAGMPLALAELCQIPIALAVSLIVFRACRRHGLSDMTVAMVCVATLLVTPYAYFYDLTLSSYAVLVLAQAGFRTGFRRWEALVMTLTWVLPFFAANEYCPPGGVALSLLLLLIFLLRRVEEESGQAGEPDLA